MFLLEYLVIVVSWWTRGSIYQEIYAGTSALIEMLSNQRYEWSITVRMFNVEVDV